MLNYRLIPKGFLKSGFAYYDSDEDGYSNLKEFEAQTDPTNADSKLTNLGTSFTKNVQVHRLLIGL